MAACWVNYDCEILCENCNETILDKDQTRRFDPFKLKELMVEHVAKHAACAGR